jgi:C4-dicarboxylate-specific signal transduction histidine kinase
VVDKTKLDMGIEAGRDITDLREAREQLHGLRRQAAAASQQSAVGASIAHEINQPLGAIVANANASLRFLSGDRPDLDEAKEALAGIIENGHRAAEVIRAIRAMFGKERQERAPLDVNEVVREVLALRRATRSPFDARRDPPFG